MESTTRLQIEHLEARNTPSYTPAATVVGGAVLQPDGILQLVPQDQFPVYYKIEPGDVAGQIDVYYRDTFVLTHGSLFPDLWAHTDFNQADVHGVVYIGNGTQTNYSNQTSVPDLNIWASSGSVVHGGTGDYSNLGIADGAPTSRVPGGGLIVGRAKYNNIYAGPGVTAVGSWNPQSFMVYHVYHGTTIYDDNAPEVIDYLDAPTLALAQWAEAHYWPHFV
jgi:hypothetical protein